MTDERNGSLRACEHDATCHAPAIRQVRVLRPGWKVAEPRLYCFEHAAQVEAAAPPIATPKPVDHPVPRPLRAEVLAALQRARGPLSVRAIADELTRPAALSTVRRELEALVDEGLAVEGPPSRFARGPGPVHQEEPVKPSKTRHPYSTLTQHERVIEDVRLHPWTSVDIMRRTEDSSASARLVQAVQAGTLVRIGEKRSYRYAIPGTPIPGLGAEGGPTMPVEGESADCNAVAPPEVVSASAPAVAESPDWGVADPAPAATGRPRTLAERLAVALGVNLSGGDVALVEAVEAAVAERDRLRVVWESVTTTVGMGGHEPEAIARDVERQIREKLAIARECFATMDLLTEAIGDYDGRIGDGVKALVAERARLAADLANTRAALKAAEEEIVRQRDTFVGAAHLRAGLEEVLDVEPGALDVEELIAKADPGARESRYESAYFDFLHRVRAAIGLTGQPHEDELVRGVERVMALARKRVDAPVALATRTAKVVEVGGAGRRLVGVNLELDGGVVFVALYPPEAKALAPLLFEEVLITFSRPPAPVRVAPVEPAAHAVVMPTVETPDDDIPF